MARRFQFRFLSRYAAAFRARPAIARRIAMMVMAASSAAMAKPSAATTRAWKTRRMECGASLDRLLCFPRGRSLPPVPREGRTPSTDASSRRESLLSRRKADAGAAAGNDSNLAFVLLCVGPLSSSVESLLLESSSPRYVTARVWPPPSRPPTPSRGRRRRPALHRDASAGDPRRQSRGSGCESWVHDPALSFYPSTHDPSCGPQRRCSLDPDT